MGRRAIELLTTLLLLDLLYHGVALKETDDEWHRQNSLRRTMTGDQSQKLKNTMSQREVITPLATVPVINPMKPSTSIPLASPTTTVTPDNNRYATPAMGNPTTSSGQSWCIASQVATPTALQVALDYACGYGGADCSTIQPGSTCYNPDSLQGHASYAFNSYYQKNPTPTSCNFGGNAVLTNIDPSTASCKYPSTSTTSSLLNTSNQSGSRVFGSAPPDSSVLALQPASIPSFDIACILVAVFSIILL